MFSAKQGHYWYLFLKRLWYDAVLDWGLNPGPPELEASTIPLGYRGGLFMKDDFANRQEVGHTETEALIYVSLHHSIIDLFSLERIQRWLTFLSSTVLL